ncbi:thiamine biosynthesis lipoprotein [Anaerovirgula multivorans]|uniref:FAD:protein FMN transferase n=1 Tax=Anaerovirgula multivorans TaxID=312168 RepID=A0A239AND3_9FIRM|nr:FAD:protein FMN transferase [Anaerovirgula multivorans]SNR97196.1 thiamine biosynthesis lipoprotein [Anaerovirgula multivorans]
MINKIFRHKIRIALLFVVLSLVLTACGARAPKLVKENQFVLGTFGQIQAYSTSSKKGNETVTMAYQRIHEIENIMSTSVVGSDVYNINQNAGIQSVEISQETLEVIKKGLKYYELTNGAFNIGLGRLSKLWGLNVASSSEGPSRIPTNEEIVKALQHIDLNRLEINGSKVFIKDSEMTIDLGGIAKGYAVDEAVNTLKKAGIESGFVNLGGDIYVLGPKPDGTSWKMGIQTPEYGTTSVIARVELTNRSIVTSGDYQKFVIDEENNKSYHHILDPTTGYPADNELTSVTIISNTSIEGDVYSTATFVMGLEEGLRFVENLEDVEGIFVTKDKTMHATSGIKNEIEILDQSYKLAE